MRFGCGDSPVISSITQQPGEKLQKPSDIMRSLVFLRKTSKVLERLNPSCRTLHPMKTLVALALLAFFSTGSAFAAQEWHREGKLKSANAGLWRNATETQKLATCADWISDWERRRLTKRAYRTIADLRRAAEELRYDLEFRLQDVRADRPVLPIASEAARALGILRF